VRAVPLAALALVVAPAATALAASSAQIVAAPGNSYVSSSVEIDQGGRVSFANRDVTSHDVTARDRAPDGSPLFRSALVPAGGEAQVESVQYLAAGSYAFYCSVHPQMTGTLRVTTAGTPEPRPGGGGSAGGGAADTTAPHVSLAGGSRLRAVVTSDEPIAVSVVARRGRRVLARGNGRLEAAGRAAVRLKLTTAGRRALSRTPRLRVVLDAVANDAAGNRATASRRAVLRR
jgi:plastocyanin